MCGFSRLNSRQVFKWKGFLSKSTRIFPLENTVKTTFSPFICRWIFEYRWPEPFKVSFYLANLTIEFFFRLQNFSCLIKPQYDKTNINKLFSKACIFVVFFSFQRMALAGCGTPSAYELKRLENIKRNLDFMEKCGELKRYVFRILWLGCKSFSGVFLRFSNACIFIYT